MTSNRPPEKPRGLLRFGFNLPIALYRVRLGWLLGHHFLLLTHRGRKTGQLRRTVLEVVSYDARTRESAVMSAWGDRADWYRNIQASPAVEVQTGWSQYAPEVRLLGPEERYVALRTYERRYGRAFRAVMRYLGYQYDGTEASLRALADVALVVGFRPRAAS
ncbi:MAG TPA: nitroreductase family deazaflavin-dependent oxidoreductase [Ktedonobacterales bacterium]